MTKIIKRHNENCATGESSQEEFNEHTAKYMDALADAIGKAKVTSLDDEDAVDIVPLIRALTTIAASCLKQIPDEEVRAGACDASVKTLALGGGEPFKRHVMAEVDSMDDMESRCNVAGFSRPLNRKDYN